MWFMAGFRNILRAFYRKPLDEHTLNLKSSLPPYRVPKIVYDILTYRFFLDFRHRMRRNTIHYVSRASSVHVVWLTSSKTTVNTMWYSRIRL